MDNLLTTSILTTLNSKDLYFAELIIIIIGEDISDYQVIKNTSCRCYLPPVFKQHPKNESFSCKIDQNHTVKTRYTKEVICTIIIK